MTSIASNKVASEPGPALGAILREAALTALVAFLLTLPLVGLRTVESGGSVSLRTDFTSVALAVGLVFLGRIGMILNREGYPVPVLAVAIVIAVGATFTPLPGSLAYVVILAGSLVLGLQALLAIRRSRSTLSLQERDQRMDQIGAKVQQIAWYVGSILVAFAIALPMLPFADRGLLGVAILVMTYIMLGWGLNIIVGLAGLLDLGYVAFYAVGAYSYALLAQWFDFSFWLCLPLAGLFAAFAGLLLGYPVLRLRGDYFAIVTLGFGEIIRIVLLNWADVTGGPNGISGIPRPSFFGLPFDRSPDEGVTSFHQFFGLDYDATHRVIFLYYLILALALLVNLISMRLRKLPLGRAWEALREDDIACQALGINRTNMKLAAFMISASFGGLAGSFFATYQGFISPESFSFIESAIILAIVVLGGMGSQLGIVIAALLLIGLPEFFRGLEEYRMLAFGLSMVLIMVWRPRGLLAHREPSLLFSKYADRLRAGKPAGGAQ